MKKRREIGMHEQEAGKRKRYEGVGRREEKYV